MEIDWRIAVVLLPLIVAASWALFNIGAAALRQVQTFLNRSVWTSTGQEDQKASCSTIAGQLA